MPRIPHDLPIAEVYPCPVWCPTCGEFYCPKVRMTAPAPFEIHCFCRTVIDVDPKSLILLPVEEP